MARQRPVAAVSVRPHQQRSIFSGSNNNVSRINDYIVTIALSIHDAMVTAAATFPTPPVTMVQFATDIAALQAAKQALGVKGTRGSQAATLAMRAARIIVEYDLSALAGYVQAVARASAPAFDIWTQYGLVALARYAKKHQGARPRTTNRFLPAPQWVRNHFSKKHNVPGYTRIRFNKVKGAKAYNVYATTIVLNVRTYTFISTITRTWFSENIGLGNTKQYAIQPVDNFGTVGGISAPIKAIAFVNP